MRAVAEPVQMVSYLPQTPSEWLWQAGPGRDTMAQGTSWSAVRMLAG